MSAQAGPWLAEEPDKPGVYDIMCSECGSESQRVGVIRRQSGELWVIDIDVGNYPLEIYHANLCNLRWRRH